MAQSIKETVLGAFQEQMTPKETPPAKTVLVKEPKQGEKVVQIPSKDEESGDEPELEKEATKEGDESQDGDEEDEELEGESRAARTEKALQLLEALENPEKRKTVIKFLNASLDDVPEARKPAAAKNILEELAEDLGPENQYLIEPLLKSFEKLYGFRSASLRAEIDELRSTISQQQLTGQWDTFIEAKNVSIEEQALMQEYAAKVKPSEKVSFKEYLVDLHTLAQAKLSKKISKEKKAEQINKNKEENKQQSVSKTTAKEPSGASQKESEVKTAKDAVRLAMAQLSNQQED